MAKGIRSYGPGKFYTILDGYAYEVGLDGFDEEESYPDGGGSYGLLRLDDSAREAISKTAADNEDQLTKEEEDQLDDSVAIIFFERSDGIVEVDWFDDLAEAEDEWADIEEEFEEMEGDE
jgi:hypothetical protein